MHQHPQLYLACHNSIWCYHYLCSVVVRPYSVYLP